MMTLSLQVYDQILTDSYCLSAFLSRVSFLNSEITLTKQAHYNDAFYDFSRVSVNELTSRVSNKAVINEIKFNDKSKSVIAKMFIKHILY